MKNDSLKCKIMAPYGFLTLHCHFDLCILHFEL